MRRASRMICGKRGCGARYRVRPSRVWPLPPCAGSFPDCVRRHHRIGGGVKDCVTQWQSEAAFRRLYVAGFDGEAFGIPSKTLAPWGFDRPRSCMFNKIGDRLAFTAGDLLQRIAHRSCGAGITVDVKAGVGLAAIGCDEVPADRQSARHRYKRLCGLLSLHTPCYRNPSSSIFSAKA